MANDQRPNPPGFGLVTARLPHALRRTETWALITGIGASSLLAAGVLSSGRTIWLIAPALAVGLVAYRQTTDRSWPATLWLLVQLLAIAGVKRPPVLLLPAALLSLASWDLDGFGSRLREAPRVYRPAVLFRRHLAYLIGTLLLGGSLAALAVQGRFELAFAPAALLVIVVLFGLNWLLRRGDLKSAG